MDGNYYGGKRRRTGSSGSDSSNEDDGTVFAGDGGIEADAVAIAAAVEEVEEEVVTEGWTAWGFPTVASLEIDNDITHADMVTADAIGTLDV